MPRAMTGTLSATGYSEVLEAEGQSGFSYRLEFTRTSGDLTWDLGRTIQGKPTFSLTGTWAGTVTVERAPGRGGDNLVFTPLANESYTSNDSRVIE